MESTIDHRARIFLLTNDNEWTDIATGTCRAHVSDEPAVPSLSILNEEQPDTQLYATTIGKEAEVSVQQDTVISWTRPDGTDIAVSFETQIGCEAVWSEICRYQGKSYSALDNVKTSVQMSSQVQQLPEVIKDDTLPDIDTALQQSLVMPFVKRQLAAFMVDTGYVGRLLRVFTDAETNHQLPSTVSERLFSIFRSLVLLNSPQLLKELLKPENVLQVAGVFEYEPQAGSSRPEYRKYLADTSRYRQIITLKSPGLLALIHETFRAQYYKDVILPRVLDDDTFTTLVMLIRSNHMEIISGLEAEGEIYDQMYTFFFRAISNFYYDRNPFLETDSPQEALEVCKFFKEFLTIARTSTNPSQIRLYQYALCYTNTHARSESMNKFLTFVHKILSNQQMSGARGLAVELLLAVCQHDPHILRQSIASSNKQSSLLSAMIECFQGEPNVGVRWQLVQVLRTVVDNTAGSSVILSSTNSPGHSRSIDECLNQFYPLYATRLLQPIIDLDKSVDLLALGTDTKSDDILFHLCDLLTFFITAHKYRIKYLLLRSFIVQNILLLFAKHPLLYMKAAALRVFRTMIGTGDDFYFRFFVKHGSFKPIFLVFQQVDGRNNLLESALFELFEGIRAGHYRILINHLIEEHVNDLKGLSSNLYERLNEMYLKLNPQLESNESANASNGHDEYFERLGECDDSDSDCDDREEGEQEPDTNIDQINELRPYSPSKRSKLG